MRSSNSRRANLAAACLASTAFLNHVAAPETAWGADPEESPGEIAMRWWNALDAERKIAAIHGADATAEQAAAAAKTYGDLDMSAKGRVDVAAAAIYGPGGFDSVGAWWESLDCRRIRIAVGDGNVADPTSPFCAHYPGSGAEKILGRSQKDLVDEVGEALLDRDDPGVFPPHTPMAMRWWNTLNADQAVAALHGDDATPEQAAAAMKMYADLDMRSRGLVNNATALIHGNGGFDSVGEWWESLDCRKKRIAVGDGNMADPTSPFCAHYPGSGAAQLLRFTQRAFVDRVGQALLDRKYPGTFPPWSFTARLQTDAHCDSDGLCRVKAGQMVTLKDASPGGSYRRSWDLQSGEGSTDSTVQHSWSEPGFYEVTLTAFDRGFRGTDSRTFRVEASDPPGLCVPTATTVCLQGSRFSASAHWWSTDGNAGSGLVAPAGTDATALFTFHSPDNWEILLKVLDGCSLNGGVWALAASATDLGYSLRVTDTITGVSREYGNVAGRKAPAHVDTAAFVGACDGSSPSFADHGAGSVSGGGAADLPLTRVSSAVSACDAGSTTLCLHDGAYEVTVDWSVDSGDVPQPARVARAQTTDSGLLYFFDPTNWEVLVKVLDGCELNGHYWVFAATATDLQLDFTVRHRRTGVKRLYTKESGIPEAAITDLSAFALACSP